MSRIIPLFFVILSFSLTAHAESRYVTDQILIALRPAQNDTAEPLEYLPTGMRVEVIEDLGTFLKIKSATNKVGFARSKYFMLTAPTGRSGESTGLQEQLATALKANVDLSNQLQQLKSAPPATVVQTESPQKTEKDRTETAVIRQERDQLKLEIDRLKEVNKNVAAPVYPVGLQLQWFLAGAAVLLVGWLAGKSTRSKRRF